jgi:hypothetical protein
MHDGGQAEKKGVRGEGKTLDVGYQDIEILISGSTTIQG